MLPRNTHACANSFTCTDEKTDPKEIALVKKLDRWIMVSLPHIAMVVEENKLTVPFLAYALVDVLAQLS